MTEPRPSPRPAAPGVRRYGVALVFIGVALIARRLLYEGLGEHSPYQVLLAAIVGASVYGGFGPGLLAVAIGAGMTSFMYFAPQASESLRAQAPPGQTAVFAAVGLLLVFVIEHWRRVRARWTSQSAELVEARAEFASQLESLAAAREEAIAAARNEADAERERSERLASAAAADNKTLAWAREAADGGALAKSQFLAHVSGQIREPLGAVAGALDLLADSKLDGAQQPLVERGRSSARLLLAFLGDVLDFAALEAGKLELEIADFSLSASLQEAVRAAGGPAQTKGLRIACQIDPRLEIPVRGDANRFRQVLIHLLANAIKYVERGAISVRANLVQAGPESVSVRIEVQDTGPGIAPDRLAKIFEPFEQGDLAARRKHGGAGLGLSLSKRLVEAMGGKLGVNSELGKGSTFWIALGFKTAAVVAAPSSVAELRGRRALVVAPGAPEIDALAKPLRAAGLEVVGAGDLEGAAEAVDEADQADLKFDLLIVDGPPEKLAELRNVLGLEMPAVLLVDAGAEPPSGAGAVLLVRPPRLESIVEAVTASLGIAGPSSSPAIPQVPPVRNRRPRVLLAERDVSGALVLRTALERSGAEVVVAPDGESSLRCLLESPFDLLVIACQLPGLDGWETVRRYRE
ncbi:MAG TPA: ATP-binding protein, partial [Planctomycetia bacterium]|nr:ATP-binding protein [Planctomycetia bacterium]